MMIGKMKKDNDKKKLEKAFILACESLSFGNPVSGLIVELLIYVFVDREFKDERLKELISSSRYSDNINVGSMYEEEFKERC